MKIGFPAIACLAALWGTSVAAYEEPRQYYGCTNLDAAHEAAKAIANTQAKNGRVDVAGKFDPSTCSHRIGTLSDTPKQLYYKGTYRWAAVYRWEKEGEETFYIPYFTDPPLLLDPKILRDMIEPEI